MAVELNQPRPRVNLIGLSSEEVLKRSPNPKIRGDFARRSPNKVLLINPDGDEELVLRDNVRDFLRLRNYTMPASKEPKTTKAEAATEDAPLDAELAAAQSKIDEQAEAVNKLEGLRNMLRDFGVEPNGKWGLRRLTEELAKARTALPNEHDDQVDATDQE